MDFSFCPQLADLQTSTRIVGASGRVFENPHGHSTPNNLHVLRSLMQEMNAERTLECGLAFGGSCLLFTASHRELGHTPRAQHVAIDPLQTTFFDSAGLLRIEEAGLRPYLSFRGEPSSLALPQLVREGAKFDLVYIDGSHVFEGVMIDAYYCTRLLREGGIMAFDDSTIDHVSKVLQFLRRNQRHCLQEVDLSKYRPNRNSGLKWRLARALHRAQLTAFRRQGDTERQEWGVPMRQF